MKTFLRSIRSGQYLQNLETWTPNLGTAYDFETIPRALDLVHRHGLKDMELVLTDDAAATPTRVPVAKLPPLLEVDHNEPVDSGGEASERKVKPKAKAKAAGKRSGKKGQA